MASSIGSTIASFGASYIPDFSDTADIQAALKYLYYGSTGAANTSNGIYGALYTLYSGSPTFAGNVTITGNLTVNGNTTTINSTTITVDDKLIELGDVATPSNTTADGGGIKLLDGSTGKTIIWDNANSNWTTSENWNLATGKTLKINNVDIASGTGAALVLGANASTSLALGNASGTTTLNGTLAFTNANKTMATLMGYTSTVTSATPVVLTNTSSYYQQFTGSTAQTVTLPVTSTLATGWTFHIVNNNTSGNLTVNSSGGNLVITVIPGTTAMVTCIGTTLTTAADWESGLTDFSTYTGSGNVVMATSPTLTTPTADIINAASASGTSSSLYNNLTTGTMAIGSALTTGVINIATATGFTSATGGQSVINIATGANTANTKTVNIGNAGSGGTSVINLGTSGAAGTQTINTYGSFKIGGTTTIASGVSGTVTLPSTAGTLMDNKMTTIGDILYASATGTPATYTRLAGNTATQPSFLSSTGNGTANTTTAFTSSTGSGNVVLVTSPTFATSVIGSASMDVFNTVSTTLNIGGAATTLTLGNTATAAQTVNMFTASTGGSTYSFATGATSSGTKTINIGTNATTGGTTAINIGTSSGTPTSTTVSLGNNTASTTSTVNLYGQSYVGKSTAGNSTGTVTGFATTLYAQSSSNSNAGALSSVNGSSLTIQSGDASLPSGLGSAVSGNLTLDVGDATAPSGSIGYGTINIGTKVVGSGITKGINIGTGGASGSVTNITLGSTTSGATGTVAIYGSLRIQTPPAVITGTTYTVGINDTVLVFNTTAACTVTMPSAATYTGRVIWMKQIAAFAVSSSSSTGNLGVQPLTSVTPGTAILSGAGKFAQLVSNGTDWVIMNAN